MMEKIIRLAYLSKNRRVGGFCCCWGLVLGAFRGNSSVVGAAAGAASTATAGCSFITTSATQSTGRMRPEGCYPSISTSSSSSCSCSISRNTAALLSSMTTWSTKASSFDPKEHYPPGTRGTPVFDDVDVSVGKQENCESMKRNRDTQAVFVVTGANRGLGFQFCKALLQEQRTQGTIVACCRSPESATDLLELVAKTKTNTNSNRIIVIGLDLESQESIEQAGHEIRQRFARVDLLLNVAGILGDGGKTTPGPERSLTKMDRSWLEKSLAVNVIGPVMLTKELAPLLMHSRRAAVNSNSNKNNSQHQERRPVSVVVNLSARVGSITDNGLGGWYSYRMSKAALNQATRTMALEMKRHQVWCVALHPGTTDTNLSKPFQANVKPGSLFPVEYTVNVLLNVIDSLQPENSGGFFDWAGKAISF